MRDVMAGVAAALALAGCVAPAGAPPAGVALVRVEPRPGAVAPTAWGETRLLVRAAPAGIGGQELPGAACRAESPYFTAEFQSPAQLLMPDFGEASPVVAVTCRAGTLAGSARATPERAWSGGAGGWPAVGISVGTGSQSGVGVGVGWYGGSAGGTTGAPVVRYRDLMVPLS
jgi:hypothetical protein